jgi:hypothetical protein
MRGSLFVSQVSLLAIYVYICFGFIYSYAKDVEDYIIEEDWRSSITSSFCEDNEQYRYRNFPTSLPELHTPWLWDAVFDSKSEILELTTMSRMPCRFDKSQWKDIVSLYPRFQYQFGYGLDSNILVPAHDNVTVAQENYLMGKTVDCIFYKDRSIVFTTPSLRIRGSKALSSMGTLQIRCPIPSAMKWTWNRVQLSFSSLQNRMSSYGNASAIVPACFVPDYDINRKKHNMSICTATKRADRQHMVEWIEYHRLLGVNHFFIYLTVIDQQDYDKVYDNLRDYIDENILTIVPWQFMNCVRNMGSGRWMPYRKKGEIHWFRPPSAIAQSTALASCYSRFKYTSKYIAHIDDDEFLVFSPKYAQIYARSEMLPKTLTDLADMVFDRNPRAAALRFNPVQYMPCNINPKQEYVHNNVFENENGFWHLFMSPATVSSTPLPRLGVWDQPYRAPPHEGKMIMRTEAVGMFFVHFISLLEYGPWRLPETEPLPLPLDVATMLHYRYPYQWSRQALEGGLPITRRSLQLQCENSRKQGYLDSSFHAKIPREIANQLKMNFVERMKK